MSDKVRAVVEVGTQKFLLPENVTEAELLVVIKLFGRAKRVEQQWTPDYQERRFVVKHHQYAFGLNLDSPDAVCTEAEFETLSEAHPKKEDK